MHGCRSNDTNCGYWAPSPSAPPQTINSSAAEKTHEKPFAECLATLRALDPIPDTRNEAEEVIDNCMLAKGWEFVRIVGGHR